MSDSDSSRSKRSSYSRRSRSHHRRTPSRHYGRRRSTSSSSNDRITSLEQKLEKCSHQVERVHRDTEHIHDILDEHHDHIGKISNHSHENIFRLESKFHTDLYNEQEQRINCEEKIEQLTDALNESREKIQALLDFCFTDRSKWKEGAPTSNLTGSRGTLDVPQGQGKEGVILISNIPQVQSKEGASSLNIGADTFEFLI